MIKALIASFFSILLFLTPAYADNKFWDNHKVANEQIDETSWSLPFGSGSLYNSEKGYVLTAEHVIRPYKKLRTGWKDMSDGSSKYLDLTTWDTFISGRSVFNEHRTSKVIAFNIDLDIAVIEVGPVKGTPVKIAKDAPVRLDSIWTVGNPAWYTNIVTVGTISGSSYIRNKKWLTPINTPLYNGSSGGGVFNDNGELVGISDMVTSKVIMGGMDTVPITFLSNMIPTLVIIKFLKDNNIQ